MNNSEKSKNKKSILWAVILMVVLIALYILYPARGLYIVIVAFLSFLLGYAVFLYHGRKKSGNEEPKENLNIDKKNTAKESIDEMFFNMPCAVICINADGTIKQYNNFFVEMFKKSNINNIKELFEKFEFDETERIYEYGEKFYEIRCSKNSKSDVHYAVIEDVTKTEKMKSELENQTVATGFIYIDNYDEIFNNVDTAEMPILTAMIDNRLNGHISKLGGTVKKFEKDRYVFVINKNGLDAEVENRFDILNEIRETRVSENMNVTLSIGIGTSYLNVADAMKNAKEAIDLAMGRGGDQAVIKTENGYQFFGAKSGEVSYNSRVRARVKAEALRNLIEESDVVLVMGHKSPDFDSIGSSIGVYRIAVSLGKECHIVLGNITAAVKNVYDRFAGNEEYNGIFIKEDDALKLMNDKALLVVVDTHITYLVESEKLLNLSNKTVVFDHHRKSQYFIENAVLVYHEPYASSASELITEMIRHLGNEVKLKPLEADALLAGIVVDTKNFGIRAGAVTFEAAAFLRRNGADSTRVRYLFKNDLEIFKLKAEAVKRAEIYKDGIIISNCDNAGENSNMLAAQTADELLNVTGIKASIVLCRIDEKIYVSARSYGDINVQVLLEKIGGGGHLTMAGAQFDSLDMNQAMEKIKEAVDSYIKEEE